MNPFIYSKIAGVTFEGRQEQIKRLVTGEHLFLEREPENSHDCNAIKIMTAWGVHIGDIKSALAEDLAEAMDRGIKYSCQVAELTGGKIECPHCQGGKLSFPHDGMCEFCQGKEIIERSLGVNIRIRKEEQ